MKRLLLLLLLVAGLCLAACPAAEIPEDDGILRLQSPAPDTYFCEESGVTYTRRDPVFLPMNLSRTPYATYENEHGALLSFYALSEETKEDYLMLADPEDLYPYYVIAREDLELPKLADMKCYQILICSSEADFFWMSGNIYDQVRTLSKVERIVSAFAAGVQEDLPLAADPTVCVELIFTSASWPDLAYTCTYYEFEDGSCYMQESATGVCLRVQAGLFDGFALTPEDAA